MGLNPLPIGREGISELRSQVPEWYPCLAREARFLAKLVLPENKLGIQAHSCACACVCVSICMFLCAKCVCVLLCVCLSVSISVSVPVSVSGSVRAKVAHYDFAVGSGF